MDIPKYLLAPYSSKLSHTYRGGRKLEELERRPVLLCCRKQGDNAGFNIGDALRRNALVFRMRKTTKVSTESTEEEDLLDSFRAVLRKGVRTLRRRDPSGRTHAISLTLAVDEDTGDESIEWECLESDFPLEQVIPLSEVIYTSREEERTIYTLSPIASRPNQKISSLKQGHNNGKFSSPTDDGTLYILSIVATTHSLIITTKNQKERDALHEGFSMLLLNLPRNHAEHFY
mmetsp:Transcript_35185/g.57425  ORF Transcript_35185/g.57425 Transcript_35185/m.57425 type:complete len:231 (-) Transcript_35185:145-837(-)